MFLSKEATSTAPSSTVLLICSRCGNIIDTRTSSYHVKNGAVLCQRCCMEAVMFKPPKTTAG
jgi:formylmethanofuran dehydrogenase subunit E